MRTAAALLATALVGTLGACPRAQAAERFHATPRAGVDYYIQAYGRIDPARLPRVYSVFTRVAAAADKSSGALPQLIVVNDTQQAAAFVLEDGAVVLSQKSLDVIYDRAPREEAEARLAFVLGHELAHLASHDFWDHEASRALSAVAGGRFVARLSPAADQQRKELRADDLGFLYAAVAGYRVDRLLEGAADAQDFLSFWMTRIGADDEAGYPTPAERTQLLRARLQERTKALEAFRFGARLLHFGRYREGLALLREFQTQFPSREAFNALGYGRFGRAVSQLPLSFAWRYWLPAVNDLHTPLSELVVRAPAPAGRTLPVVVREDLLEAVRWFELAGAKDPHYLPGFVNLASAHLLLGMETPAPGAATAPSLHLLRAQLAAAAAQKLAPHDAAIAALLQVIAFELGQAAQQPSTLAAQEAPERALVAYNLARANVGTAAEAAARWREVVAGFTLLPRQLRALLCNERRSTELAAHTAELTQLCSRSASLEARPAAPPWRTPVQLSRDLLEAPLTQAERVALGWRELNYAHGRVFSGESSSLLAIDDIAAMAVMQAPPDASEILQRCCSQPLARIAVTGGELWRYDGWIVWMRDGAPREIWIAN